MCGPTLLFLGNRIDLARVASPQSHLRSPYSQSPAPGGSQSMVPATRNLPQNGDQDEDNQWAHEERQAWAPLPQNDDLYSLCLSS